MEKAKAARLRANLERVQCRRIRPTVEIASSSLERAVLARRQGAMDQAAAAYLEALALDPSDPRPLHALYYLARSAAERAVLLPQLRACLARRPPQPLGLFLEAHWLHELGEEQQACALARRAACLGLPGDRLAAAAQASAGADVLILGAPKCGTTSLAAYLAAHADVWVHPLKELHFFDNHWSRGEAWYRAQFPPLRQEGSLLRLEATPNYLQHPEAPSRVAGLLPAARLIVVLREPLDRALSWLGHMQTYVGLTGTAEGHLLAEQAALQAMTPLARQGLDWLHPNALTGSLYADQLQRWRDAFPAHQLLVLRFEDLVADPETVLQRVLRFLELDAAGLPAAQSFPVYNQRVLPSAELDPALARRLRNGVLAEAMELWALL